ncbi:signal peptidase II [Streptomyces sp. NPDC048385]|uniref:signal peptidase II n=1 Tax=unclassified Streptomyces TaxID=2593676 RepID=UPI003414AAD2
MAVPQPAPAQTRPQGHRLFFAAVAAAVVAADQAGKAWAVALHQRAGHGMGPFGPALLRNRGASFGVGAAWTPAITLLTLAALAGLVAAGMRARSRGAVAALALMAGGEPGTRQSSFPPSTGQCPRSVRAEGKGVGRRPGSCSST